MTGHFLKLPPDTLVREVWHTHTKKHLEQYLRRTDFADRAREEVGYLIPQVYSEHLRSSTYRIRWLPLEDQPEAVDGFCRIFDRFNVYTTLNRYPLRYAIDRLRVMSAEYSLWLANQNIHIPAMAAQIPALEEALAKAEEDICKDCFVDLAFDFDAGAEGRSGELKDLLPSVNRLLAFCKQYEVPHQTFFSGGRGFHVVIPYTALDQTPADDNHLVNRRLAEMIQEETGDLGIDWSIYSNRRQFRLPNTRHQKSGLFKVLLQAEDLDAGIPRILEIARRPVATLPASNKRCEYLAGLYALASAVVREKKRFAAKPCKVMNLPAARQSAPRIIQNANGESVMCAIPALEQLVHPPCVQQALTKGIADPKAANRNQVTLFLACYLKAIGRKPDEVCDLLVRHALLLLAPFSHSSVQEIDNSTRTAVATVFRHERYEFNCHAARRMGFECNDTCELHAHTRETATSRKLHRVTEDPASTPAPVPNRKIFSRIEDLRADMARRVIDYIGQAKSGALGSSPVKPLLVKSPAGSGKTTVVFDLLANLELRTLWVGTRLDLYENIPSHLKTRWRRIEGRHGETTLPTGETLPANCFQPDLAHRLRERRLNVNDRLCRACEHRETCDYFRQFEDKRSSFFVQQPMYLHKVKDYASQFDVVVFDEDVLGQFLEEVRIREKDVRQLTKMLRQQRQDWEFCEVMGEATKLTPLISFLEALAHLLAETKVTQPISGTALHQRLAEAYQAVHEGTGAEAIPISLAEALHAIPPKLDSIVDSLYFDPQDTTTPLPLQFLDALLPVLRYELFERDPKSNVSRLHFQSTRQPVSDGEPAGKRRIVNSLDVVFKAEPPPLPTPTVILDATGKPEIYERLFDVVPQVYAPTMKLENQVTQVYSTSGSFGSMRQAVFLKRMLEALALIFQEEPHTLVICKQALEKQIAPVMPPEAAITHFYGNRGSNAFKDFKRVVIFGMPGLTPQTILRYAGALFYEDNLISDTEFVLRRYAGNDVGVQVLVYKESLIQAIAETAREDEILQSIHRIRPSLDPTKDILLLTNIVIPELPVTRLVSAAELREPARHSDTASRIAMLAALAQSQFDALNFVSPARTLWPVAGKVSFNPDTVAYLKSQNAWHDVPPDKRIARTTLHDHKGAICKACGLVPFEVWFRTPAGRSTSEIWGRDSSCIESARRFFAGHPAHSTETLEVVGG